MFVTPGSRSGRRRLPPSGLVFPAQGRLTLQSGVPVMTTTQSGKTSIFWTPSFGGRSVPVWNGHGFNMLDVGGELTNVTTASAVGFAGPAAVTTNSNYDLFAWGSPGAGILTRGGVWNSSTVRSSGTENDLLLLNGIYVNKNAIANGPPAQFGTYLGTVRSNGSSQIDFILGAAAAGGTAGVGGVWNMYNRTSMSMFVGDSTANWTYVTTSYRQVRASAGNQISVLIGLQEDIVTATAHNLSSISASGANVPAGVGVNSTSANSAQVGTISQAISAAALGNSCVTYTGYPGLGYNTIALLEIGAANVTFYGSGLGPQQTGMYVTWRG